MHVWQRTDNAPYAMAFNMLGSFSEHSTHQVLLYSFPAYINKQWWSKTEFKQGGLRTIWIWKYQNLILKNGD